MASEDPLDLAYTAISRVADTALLLGAKHKRPICGHLGALLFLVTNCLATADLDEEERLQLMRHVETICRWPVKLTQKETDGTLLKTIAQSEPHSSQYMKAQADIQKGIMNITANGDKDAEEAIAQLQQLINTQGNTKRDETDEDRKVKEILVNLLQEEMSCTCDMKAIQQMYNGHLAQLLLQPPSQSMIEQGLLQYNMLLSSTAVSNGTQFRHWQDVELTFSRTNGKSKKSVNLSNHNTGSSLPLTAPPQLVQVGQGQFRKLISSEANSRICLTVHNGKLYQSGFKPIEQIVVHTLGISLADILRQYYLTPKMKVVLTYFLAHAAWRHCYSDWVDAQWTSDRIRFMDERPRHIVGQQSNFFAWKPYLSVHVNQNDIKCHETSGLDDKIRLHPKIQALGIILVEIWVGSPLYQNTDAQPEQSLAAKADGDLGRAVEYLKNEKLWEDCDFPNYRKAVNSCLDSKTFPDTKSLEQHRDVLYDEVVLPLADLLRGIQWMDKWTEIGPLSRRAEKLVDQVVLQHPLSELATKGASLKRPANKVLSKSQKAAKLWLSRTQRLNDELADLPRVPVNPPPPVRIAVLDTGCDDESLFFLDLANASRLREWKDWTEGSDEYQDCHGHGTYLTSLVMKLSPGAQIYVARVARNPEHLLDSSENIAKAILWASQEWKADIILMSFGFKEEQPCISKAIREVMFQRDDSILLFAAASNYGANEQEMFPARYESVISIRGTNANGEFEDFNPPRSQNEALVFGTLGLDVPSAGLSDCNEEVYKSGTSVAAAVAAGIAGLLLEYVSNRSEKPSSSVLNKKLRTRQGMRAAFMEIASRTQKEHCLYLTPWKLMGKPEEARWGILLAAVDDVL
ncbi:peptidase S8/S53 domain-containing protein [Trichoderma austrokoningii]